MAKTIAERVRANQRSENELVNHLKSSDFFDVKHRLWQRTMRQGAHVSYRIEAEPMLDREFKHRYYPGVLLRS